MPQFAYEARDGEGHLTGGLISAATLEEAGNLLSQRELFVIRLGRDRFSDSHATPASQQERGGASRADVAWCMSQLAIMVETGIPLSDALEYLARQASQPRVKMMLEQISKSVNEGRSLSEAVAMYPKAFPKSLTAMIRASEMSGTLTQILQRSSAYLMEELRVRKQVRGALMYPLFMFLTCIAVTVFLLAVILPRFADIFATRGALLPWPTRMLMAASDSLVLGWYYWVGGTLGSVLLVYIWSRTAVGRRTIDYLVLNTPILASIFNPLYQSRSFRTMAVLLGAGVSLVDAVKILQDVVPNSYYRDLWVSVDKEIQHGERLGGPLLESELIPEHVAHMVDTGDRSGKLGLVFSRLSEFIEEQYNQAVRAATQFIEPCMILFMGALIGFVAASLMLPLFQAGQVVAQ